MRREAVQIAVALTCIALATSGAAVSAVPGPVGDTSPGMTAEPNTTNETGFGVAVSSFVQSEAAQTEGAVEQGVWAAKTANVSQQAVDKRAAALSKRIQRLKEQRAALKAAYRNGSVTRVAYAARLAAINAQLQAISTAANHTRAIAQAAGVNATEVAEVGDRARQARGPPDDAGPPEDAGPPDDRGQPGDSESESDESRGGGPPKDRENESNRGSDKNRTTTADGS